MLSRRRYQNGSLRDECEKCGKVIDPALPVCPKCGEKIKHGDRWIIRWREDVINPLTQEIRRVYRQDWMLKADFPTKKLAQRELAKRVAVVNRDDYRPAPAETCGGFLDRFESLIVPKLEPSTQHTIKSDIKVHIKPYFGKFQMRDISAELIQRWASGLSRKPDGGIRAPKTVFNIVTSFKIAWKTAKNWGYVTHNPFEGIKLPKFEKGNVYFFSPQEAKDIINAASDMYKLFFGLLYETGMRPGEAAGLRPEDISEIGGISTVKIAQSTWKGQVKPTVKTPNARRRLVLSSGAAKRIRQHIHDHPNLKGLIFVNKDGHALNTETVVKNVLNPILDKLGIKAKAKEMGLQVGLYAFRHGNGTLQDDLHVQLKTRISRMGHSDPKTTILHYTGVVDENEVRFAEQAGALIWDEPSPIQ